MDPGVGVEPTRGESKSPALPLGDPGVLLPLAEATPIGDQFLLGDQGSPTPVLDILGALAPTVAIIQRGHLATTNGLAHDTHNIPLS